MAPPETARSPDARFRRLAWRRMWSRRLPRRHLMHFAGLLVEADPIDAIKIRTGHANEARVIWIIDGMNFAVLIDAGVTGRQPIFFHRLELGMLGIAAVILALPFGHISVMGRLPVDRPRGAVIVWRRDARLVVDVGEDLEAEFWILVEDMKSTWRLFAMLADKIRIAKQGFKLGADLLAAFRSRVALQDCAAIGDKLVELIGHCVTPSSGCACFG